MFDLHVSSVPEAELPKNAVAAIFMGSHLLQSNQAYFPLSHFPQNATATTATSNVHGCSPGTCLHSGSSEYH